MGKRKERRMAAMSAAGRRVKLDLFADEPSYGDLGGSKDNVGEDEVSAGLPKSPSSSGQQPENPLSLLGQYSDDELDEESGEALDTASGGDVAAEVDQANVYSGEKSDNTDIDTSEEVLQDKVDEKDQDKLSSLFDASHEMAENGVKENEVADSGDLNREVDMVEEASVPGESGTQISGDQSSCWKMVLHEESNSYYYWNIVTGETSWDVPVGTALVSDSISGKSHVPDGGQIVVTGAHTSSSTVVDSEPSEKVQNEGQTVETPRDKNHDVHQIDAEQKSAAYHNHLQTSLPLDYAVPMQSLCANAGVRLVEDNAQHEMADLYSRLIRQGEYLLGRLESLKSSGGCIEHLSKHKVEIEIRLCDMRCLVSYGPTLLPFWLHSENQLKKLEAAINSESEIIKYSDSGNNSGSEAVCKSGDKTVDDIKTETTEKSGSCSTPLGLNEKVSQFGVVDKDTFDIPAVQNGSTQCGYPNSFSNSDAVRVLGDRTVGLPAELSKSSLNSGEDTDMDVEMEVEDATPANDPLVEDTMGMQYAPPKDHTVYPNIPSQHESIALEEGFGIPPPPDDAWIPPPPPDEPYPPPPPDEPPEVPPPPSDVETVQPFSYAQQYNLSYPESSFEYYGQTHTEVPSSAYYMGADGCQMAASIPPIYYAAVPNTYVGVPSTEVCSVESAAYYALPEGSVHSAPVSSVETSALHGVSAQGSVVPAYAASSETHKEASSTLQLTSEADVSAASVEIPRASVEAQFVPASTQAPTTFSVAQDVPTASVSVANSTVSSTGAISKAQSKVVRSKKRTVAVVSTLRSNKKVSGLVDKWRAAKEELHNDEDEEPENAYDALEKKRQREIERWRAQQIATGEAKENANFQPLGGDWRERVKRKRAKMMSEGEQTLSAVIEDGNQPPDLNEISRALPLGWQAYWDESSKQVYYGNSTTSETTWIRPTN